MVKLRRVDIQHKVNEMSQPRYRSVDLLIPPQTHPPFEGVTITFLTRLIDKSTTHKYIEITDTPSPNVPDRIKERVYLPNGVNSETLPSDKSQEETELSCFIDKIISKYCNNVPQLIDYIRKAITDCYNEYVVDHSARSQSTTSKDYCYVVCNNGKIEPKGYTP